MSSNKTKPTATSVHLFLEELVPEEKKADSWALYQMMERLTGARGILWGTSIIGFGGIAAPLILSCGGGRNSFHAV